MSALRLCQILHVFLIGGFAASVTLNNLVDPRSNLRFVTHLLSMDTIFPDSTLRRRAITSPTIHRLAFALIVMAEGLTALLCLAGAGWLAWHLGANAEVFEAAKAPAFAGLALGFGLWFGGFMIVGGQWFASWQSAQWNGRESAFMFYSAIGVTTLLLAVRA